MTIVVVYPLLFLLTILLVRQISSPHQRQWFQLGACFVLLFGFFGFRDITVLNDTSHYYGFYYQWAHYKNYVKSSVFTYRLGFALEWGYQVIMHVLMKYVSKNPYTIILFSSLVITIGNLWFQHRHTKSISLTCFFMLISGIFFAQYGVIRQSFALVIFYYAYHFLEERRPWPFCLLVLVAALFHISALAMLALPLLQRLRVNARNISLLLLLTALTALLILQALSSLGLANNPYYKMAMEREGASLASLFDIVIMAIPLLTCVWLHCQMRLKEINRLYFWTCFYGMCIALIEPTFYIVQRLNIYIWPIVILQLLKYVNPEYRFAEQTITTQRPLRSAMLVTMMLVFVGKTVGILLFRPEWLHIIPYSFYDFSSNYHYYHLYWNI